MKKSVMLKSSYGNYKKNEEYFVAPGFYRFLQKQGLICSPAEIEELENERKEKEENERRLEKFRSDLDRKSITIRFKTVPGEPTILSKDILIEKIKETYPEAKDLITRDMLPATKYIHKDFIRLENDVYIRIKYII